MFRPLSDHPGGTVSTCPKCNQPFRSADSPHVPLILSCRHLCCEECIRTAFCTERQIVCKECGVPSTAKTSLDVKLSNLRESFPLSEKMIEEINKLTQMKPVDESSIGFKTSKRSSEKPSSNTSLHEGACDECHNLLAVFECSDCKESIFCEKCCYEVHRFNINQKHDLKPLSSISFTPLEKKPEYVKQLKESREKLMKKEERIERTLKMLANPDLIKEARTSGINVQQVRDDLKQFFLHCQNTIKCLENQVMNEFESVALSLDNSLAKCVKQLNHSSMEITELLRDIYKISGEEFFNSSSVEKLLAKSHDLLETPDTVQTKRPICGTKKIEMPSDQWINILESQLNFDFGKPGEIVLVKNRLDAEEMDGRDSSLTPLMSTSCAGDIGDVFEKTSHSSLTSSDQSGNQARQRRPSKSYSVPLPLSSNNEYCDQEYCPSESLPDTGSSVRGTPGVRGLHPNINKISGPSLAYCGSIGAPRNYYDQKTAGLRANFGRQVRFREGWKGPVVISCVSAPSYFYVQLGSGLVTLQKYRKFFSKASSAPPIDKKDIKMGNMYLAQCSDGEWYRVRFTQIIPNDQSVLVTQIDTGRNEMVDLSNLRRIDDIMKSAGMDPEIAIQCCIYDCYPVSTTWREEDNELFTEILKDKQVTMIVKKVQSNKLEVDLEWNENGSHMSIRDYMLMSKKACLNNTKKINSSVITTDGMKYFKDREFQPKEWVDVKVTFVYGPHEIYVRRHDTCSEKKFANMNTNIDSFYKNNSNYKTYAVINPTIGLPVAAQFTVDNTWYRAEIINLIPQSKKAEVQYVDFGNKEVIPFSKIRQLAKEFIRFTIQTIRCSLSGIKPPSGSNYKSLATNFIIKNVEDEMLKMVVSDVKDDEISVILYKINENEDVCVNLLLVEEGYARKFGDVLGKDSVYPKRRPIQTSIPKNVEKKLSTNASKEDEVDLSANVDENVERNDVDSDDDEENENESEISSSEEMLEKDDVNHIPGEKPRYRVKITTFISPNLFYVSLVGQLAAIQKLNDDMLKFYRDEKNSEPIPVESIEKGLKCVAYSNNDEKWYRAKVLELEENEYVKVFFKDVAREEFVKSQNLRGLEPEFDKLVDGAVACSMINIEERAKWPARLCESLMNTLDSYSSVYLTKFKMIREKGESTLPVELWGKRVTCQGAFAPATEEWTNVNHLLSKALQNDDLLELESGSNQEQLVEPKEDSVKNVEGGICEISSTETVKKWLHSNVVEATKKGVEYSSIVTKGEIPTECLYTPKSPGKSTVVTTKIREEKEQKSSKQVPTQDWKPAEPIDCEEFEVWPTYLDDEFCIYVQSLGKQRKVMDVISHGLQHRFETTTPLPTDLHWYPGQICIAWFFIDKKWYRGKVLKTENSKAFVEYVDYGNTEWIEMNHLRKDVALDHFPLQCHKLPIRSDCVSGTEDGKWPVKILDFVHMNILEKKCHIKLRKEKGEDFYRIEKLFLEDTGVELFDYLCQLGYATFVTSSSVKRSKSHKVTMDSKNDADDDGDEHQSDSSSSIAVIDSVSNVDLSEFLDVPGISTIIYDSFSIPQNPQDNEVLIPYFDLPVADLNIVTVEVIEILQLDEIVVHIVDSQNEAVNLNRKRFLEMNSELQRKGSDQPKLTSPSLGRMCCTKFDDNLWYRAKIIDYCTDNDFVSILYVDYGNSSRASPTELYRMKRSWFDVPMQTIRCKLIDYDGPANGNEGDLEEMLKLINNKYEAVIEAGDEHQWYKIKIFFK